MAMILIDGFDHADLADIWTASSGFALVTDIVRTGTRSANQNGAGQPTYINAYRALTASEIDDGVTMGGAFYLSSTGSTSGFVSGAQSSGLWLGEDGVIHLSANFRNDLRTIELWRGQQGSGTRLAFTDTNIFTFNTWNYLELGAVINNTTGLAEIRLNGVAVLDFAGDTRNGGTLGVVNKMGVTGGLDSGSSQSRRYDDFYLLNEQGPAPWNSFLGDTRMYPLYPNGNGFYSQLVGSDADSTDNYLLVDEPGTPNTADYVGSAIDGDKDTYEFEDMPVSVGTIQAVETRIYAAKTETGAKKIRPVIRRGTDSTGSDHILAEDSYATYRDIFELDPNEGPGPWTIPNVDNSEYGAEIRSG